VNEAALREPVTGAGYPGETVATIDGRRLCMRPMAPDDGDRLVAFHGTLSDDSVYYRFFAAHPRLSPAEVHRFTHVDGAGRVALVVLDEDRIVAVGRYDRIGESREAEVAFVVSDPYQHHGLAKALLAGLAAIAREHGVETFVAETLLDNRRMRRVFSDSGYAVRSDFRDGVVHVSFGIAEPPAGGPPGTPSP
jgi:RimJ/RimL family protein N-acetyltransferase